MSNFSALSNSSTLAIIGRIDNIEVVMSTEHMIIHSIKIPRQGWYCYDTKHISSQNILINNAIGDVY